MAAVTFSDVSKIFPDGTKAVADLSLETEDGEFMVLVGRPAAARRRRCAWSPGSRRSAVGEIRIGDRIVNEAVSPKDRDIAMVFQTYALYPHLTVFDNIAPVQPPAAQDEEGGDRQARQGGGEGARPRAVPRPKPTRASPAASGNASRWGARSSASRRPS